MLISRETRFRGRIVTVNVETVELPNGTRTALDMVHHPGGAAIAIIDDRQRICMLRQFRHAAGGWIHELPAGKLEPGETPLETARREIVEEAGVSANEWRPLGHYLSSPGVFTEVVHLFLARDLSPARAAPEAAEVFEVHWIDLREARVQALDGTLEDGKTCLAILRAAAALGVSA